MLLGAGFEEKAVPHHRRAAPIFKEVTDVTPIFGRRSPTFTLKSHRISYFQIGVAAAIRRRSSRPSFRSMTDARARCAPRVRSGHARDRRRARSGRALDQTGGAHAAAHAHRDDGVPALASL